MANGYFERGEVYWVKMGMGVGAEMNVTRPGLIISSNTVNNSSDGVLVAFLTTREHRTEWNKTVTFATGRESWVLCDQVQTVDKARFTKHLGTLSYSEMRAVEDCLEEVFDLGYADPEKDKEIEKLKAQIAELNNEVAHWQAEIIKKKAAHDEELLSYKVENAMWQKCYERSLDQLVKIKVNTDVRIRVEQKPVETQKISEPVEKTPDENPPSEEPVEDERLDINTASATALKKAGFSIALAKAVAKARPFTSVEDLKKVPGMAKTKYQILAPKLCCVPVVVKESEEPVVSQEKDPGFEKVNVNTASAKELSDALGLSLNICYAITGKRKREGLFTSLEQIIVPKRFTEGMLEKHRDKLEV